MGMNNPYGNQQQQYGQPQGGYQPQGQYQQPQGGYQNQNQGQGNGQGGQRSGGGFDNFVQITVVGRIAKDPESKPVGNGKVASAKLAINHRSEKAGTDYWFLEAWGNENQDATHNFLVNHCPKGRKVMVIGTPELRQSENNGNYTYYPTIRVTQIIGLENAKDNQGGGQQGGQQAPQQNYGQPQGGYQPPAPNGGYQPPAAPPNGGYAPPQGAPMGAPAGAPQGGFPPNAPGGFPPAPPVGAPVGAPAGAPGGFPPQQ